MNNYELLVTSKTGEKLGTLTSVSGVIQYSADTDEYFKEAINCIISKDSFVVYQTSDGRVVHAELKGGCEQTLSVLKDYLMNSFGYVTELIQSFDIKQIEKVLQEKYSLCDNRITSYGNVDAWISINHDNLAKASSSEEVVAAA